ncbi:hypothetical protein E2562_030545 [Oryza meyeriana var. granulata]|uniref:HpcH/HpaI aldolase/citrate lyase domain-containing protein n=1 Tax=Oryza meyeriana var. granulata TaxID=110450 RepID=A0A6G1D8C3_9ORYZ|nr:hypothetical protein E2562_030545 [Oryza meyeriana var. granulata]
MAATVSLSYLLLASKPNPSPLLSCRAPALLPLPRRGQRPAPAIFATTFDLLSAAPFLKSRLTARETLYRLFLLSFSPTLADLATLAGYDYVIVDMEHGPGGIPEALACLCALDTARTPAVIHLPEACPIWAKKALDLGPADHRRREETMERRRSTSERREREVEISVADRFAALPDGVLARIVSKLP